MVIALSKKRALSWATWFLLLLSAGLATAGVRDYCVEATNTTTAHDTLLIFDETVKPLGDVEAKRRIPVDYRVSNQGNCPLNILGSTYTCTRQGCLRGSNLVVEIQPGGTETIHAVLYAGAPGELRASLRLFTDAPGQERVQLTVTGMIRNPPEFRPADEGTGTR